MDCHVGRFYKAVMGKMSKRDREKNMWVIGYIDSYGAIHARTAKETIMHTSGEHLSGRCWRFNVCGQEFIAVLGCQRLDDEDFHKVVSWLKNKGYLDEERYC